MQQQQISPAIGESVITSDGEILGEVAEVGGDRFRIGVSFRRDYWLSFAGIDVIEDGAVCLSFPKSDLNDRKVGAPM